MVKFGCLVYLLALLVGCMGGSFLKCHKVDLDGLVNKKWKLQVLDWKWCLEGLFLFQVPIYCSYFMELYPHYPRIDLLGTIIAQYWYITNPVWICLVFNYCSLFHWHSWRLGGNTWGVTLFKMSLWSQQNFTALITQCNFPQRELMHKGSPCPPLISAAATIKYSF